MRHRSWSALDERESSARRRSSATRATGSQLGFPRASKMHFSEALLHNMISLSSHSHFPSLAMTFHYFTSFSVARNSFSWRATHDLMRLP